MTPGMTGDLDHTGGECTGGGICPSEELKSNSHLVNHPATCEVVFYINSYSALHRVQLFLHPFVV